MKMKQSSKKHILDTEFEYLEIDKVLIKQSIFYLKHVYQHLG